MVASVILESEPARRTLDWHRDPVRRHCRSLLVFLITVCDIDVDEPSEYRKIAPKNLGLAAQCWRKLTKSNRVSGLIRLLYTLAMVWLGVYTYYQIAHDIQLLRLERLQTLGQAATIGPSKAGPLRESFDHYDRMLDAIGSPYKRAHRFMATGVALVVMALVYILYDQSALYFYLNRTRIDSYLMNMFRDAPGETFRCADLIANQTESVLNSEANYLAFRSAARLVEREPVRRQWMRDSRGKLEQWAADGSLWPANHSAEWLTLMSRKFLSYFLVLFCACYAINLAVFFIVPLALDLLAIRTVQDWLALLAMQYLILLLIVTAAFYMSAFFLKCRDRASYLSEIHQQMIQCMRTTRDNFNTLMAAKDRQLAGTRSLARLDTSLVQAINHELMLALLRYRILLAHIKPDQTLFEFASFNLLLFPVGPPLVVRLFSTYSYDAFKLFGIMFCLFCNATSLLMLAPLGKHSHMGEIFCKTLFSLKAHTEDITGQLSRRAGRHMDEHIVTLIYRELAQPDQMIDQFSTKVFGFSINYANIVRAHFYLSLLLVSCLTDAPMLRNLLNNRADDPLGLYADLN